MPSRFYSSELREPVQIQISFRSQSPHTPYLVQEHECFAQIRQFIRRRQREGRAGPPVARHAADAVQKQFGARRKIIVDHIVEHWNVDAWVRTTDGRERETERNTGEQNT